MAALKNIQNVKSSFFTLIFDQATENKILNLLFPSDRCFIMKFHSFWYYNVFFAYLQL